MIEFCSKKRMAFAIAVLLIVSVIVLIIENNFDINNGMKDATMTPENSTGGCWESLLTEPLAECAPCSTFEMKASEFCRATGYKEQVKCVFDKGVTKEIWKSCPKQTWIEERNFWMFEGVTLLVGLSSYTMVCIRQRRLDKMLLEKVNKQIASGV